MLKFLTSICNRAVFDGLSVSDSDVLSKRMEGMEGEWEGWGQADIERFRVDACKKFYEIGKGG